MTKYILTYLLRIAKEFQETTYGKLTTCGPAFLLPVGQKNRACSFVVCRCTCGNHTVSRVDDLRNGRIISCGCVKSENTSKAHKKHGLSNSDVFKIWLGINQRCTNPKLLSFKNYGGRGVSLYPEWRSDYGSRGQGFINFSDYLGPRPSKEHSVDRYPNRDGNYEPGNVRWATREEQANNKNNNRRVVFNGEELTIAQWSARTGLSDTAIANRLDSGWSVEEALTIKAKTPRDSLKYNGQVKSFKDWGAIYGICPDTLAYRIRVGWSAEEALTTPVKKRKSDS